MTEKQEMQAAGKQELDQQVESTRPGRFFVPSVDIFETEKAIVIHADMPGVEPEQLKVDLRENVITLVGPVSAPEGKDEQDVHREYETGTFYRQFTLSDVVDQRKIDARLENGVLRLTLPKVEAAQPRRITVHAE